MKILLAIDGSDASRAAIDSVSQRPWPKGTELRVFTAVTRIQVAPTAGLDMLTGGSKAYDLASLKDVNDRVELEARNLLGRVVQELSATGCDVQPVLEPAAEAGQAIVGHAESWGADLVVLGSHGRTGIKRLLLGSVAEYVVRHAACSVEVARPRKESAQ